MDEGGHPLSVWVNCFINGLALSLIPGADVESPSAHSSSVIYGSTICTCGRLQDSTRSTLLQGSAAHEKSEILLNIGRAGLMV